MIHNPESPPQLTPDPIGPAHATDSATPAPHGFSHLARRIAGWSANLLATALVLVAGLAVGRQVLVWWYEAPPASLAVTSDTALPPETPDELRLWTTRGPVSITAVVGQRDAALARMRAECLRLTASAESYGGVMPDRELGKGEERFLEKLAKLTPVEQTEGLNVYEFLPGGEVNMVVAVRREIPRIAAWSFALEAQPSHWSCYTFCPAANSPGLDAGSESPGVDAGVNRRAGTVAERGSAASARSKVSP